MNDLGTMPRIFPFWMTAAALSSMELIRIGSPTMMMMFNERVTSSRRNSAFSQLSNSCCCRKRSAQVYPVIQSSGKQMISTPLPSACAIRLSIWFAFHWQSPTFTWGTAAATLINPYFISFSFWFYDSFLFLLSSSFGTGPSMSRSHVGK